MNRRWLPARPAGDVRLAVSGACLPGSWPSRWSASAAALPYASAAAVAPGAERFAYSKWAPVRAATQTIRSKSLRQNDILGCLNDQVAKPGRAQKSDHGNSARLCDWPAKVARLK